jgi:hypothetical protein
MLAVWVILKYGEYSENNTSKTRNAQTTSNLISLLSTSEQYRLMYVKFKIWVEHKPIPKPLYQALPTDLSFALRIQYGKEEKAYRNRKGKTVSHRQTKT